MLVVVLTFINFTRPEGMPVVFPLAPIILVPAFMIGVGRFILGPKEWDKRELAYQHFLEDEKRFEDFDDDEDVSLEKLMKQEDEKG